ncbi:MAG: hypothetical protein IJA88_03830 [Clostridia bacterium]|nr:hypothetical protein [Clostridia bacterium]
MKKRLLLTSILSIVMCFSLICGATFALFTSESKVNIAVTSGTVKIEATLAENVELYSDGVAQQGTFANGGTASVSGQQATFDNFMPGDKAVFSIKVKNYSDVAIMYRVSIDKVEDTGLFEALKISFDDVDFNGYSLSAWSNDLDTVKEKTVKVSVELPMGIGDDYQDKTCKLLFKVEAVQGNAVSSTPTNATQLENALNYGGVVTLGADIVLDKPIVVNADAVATLDFAGNTISTSSNFVGTHAIENNGTLTLIDSGNAGGSGASGYASERAMVSTFAVRFEETATAPKGGIISSKGAILNKGVLTIEGGEYTAQAGAIIEVEETATVEINGGSFIAASTAVVVGGTGSVEINKVDKIEGNIIEEGSSSDVVFGGGVLKENQDDYYVAIEDGIYYKKNGNSYSVTNANGLKWLSARSLTGNNGVVETATIIIKNDIDMENADFSSIVAQYNDTLNIVGNGKTISNVNVISGTNDNSTGQTGMFYGYSGATLNVSDLNLVNIKSTTDMESDSGNYGAIVVGYAQATVNLNNVKVVDSIVTGAKSSGIFAGHVSGTLNATNCVVVNSKVIIDENTFESKGHYAGKLVGTIEGAKTVTLNNCSYDATVSGKLHPDNVGDIYGRNLGTLIVDGINMIADGFGTDEQGNYYIFNANGMVAFNNLCITGVNLRNKKVVLAADVDMQGKTWTAVDGHYEFRLQLCGFVFDGNNHVISNMNISGQAMFTRIVATDVVTFKNIIFDNATVNTTGINASILCVQIYTDTVIENVTIKNSSITGAYKVAPFVGTVYDEKSTTVTLTMRNCKSINNTVTSTSLDFCTTGLVAFVYVTNNDKVVFENIEIRDIKLYAKPNGYDLHASIYCDSKDTDDKINEMEGVTVENVTFEALK